MTFPRKIWREISNRRRRRLRGPRFPSLACRFLCCRGFRIERRVKEKEKKEGEREKEDGGRGERHRGAEKRREKEG